MSSLDHKTIRLDIYYGVGSPWAYIGATEILSIASKHSVTPHLRPIVSIASNGGIALASRPPARQAYAALELVRWARHRGVPITPKPKYVPLPPGGVELPSHAIIRAQHAYGAGHQTVKSFTYAIQRGLWAEDKDITDVETLFEIAKTVGIPEDQARQFVEDRRGDEEDVAVKEYKQNLKEAEEIGIFGTPTYVVNGELFWGQDRLSFVDEKIAELTALGYRPT